MCLPTTGSYSLTGYDNYISDPPPPTRSKHVVPTGPKKTLKKKKNFVIEYQKYNQLLLFTPLHLNRHFYSQHCDYAQHDPIFI